MFYFQIIKFQITQFLQFKTKILDQNNLKRCFELFN
jgi:hypothetical protein